MEILVTIGWMAVAVMVYGAYRGEFRRSRTDEWISLKDERPIAGRYILLAQKHSNRRSLGYTTGANVWHGTKYGIGYMTNDGIPMGLPTATHWMPIPSVDDEGVEIERAY